MGFKMGKPEYTPVISLGNIIAILGIMITLAGGIAAFSVGYGQLTARIDAVQEDVRANKTLIDGTTIASERRDAQITDRVRETEMGLAAQAANWQAVQGQLTRIEAGLDKLNDRLNDGLAR